jgi:hypothetical protein
MIFLITKETQRRIDNDYETQNIYYRHGTKVQQKYARNVFKGALLSNVSHGLDTHTNDCIRFHYDF